MDFFYDLPIWLATVFLFILIVDHPFKGEFSVSNRQLVELSSQFDRLDRMGDRRPTG